MRLNTKAFALAAGLSAAAAYTLCALAVAVAPVPLTVFFSTVTHLDLTGLSRPLTFNGFLVGLIWWAVGTSALFALVSVFYNRLAEQRKFTATSSRGAIAQT